MTNSDNGPPLFNEILRAISQEYNWTDYRPKEQTLTQIDPATLEEKFVATNSGRAESFSYTAPIAYLLELLIYWTDQSRVLTFGIAGVLGMLVGSSAMAIATKTFRW
jgi:hypothetical protein